MASTDAVSPRRSVRKVKLTVSGPQPDQLDISSNPAEVSAEVSASLDAQMELPVSQDRATDVLNQNRALSGIDGISAVRYKSKNKTSDDDGPAREGSSDFHQVCYLHTLAFIIIL